MSKAEKTRQFIIESTAELFNKKGYAGTSMTDICNATNLTKGSIYGNFKDKDEVVKAVFLYNSKQVQTGITNELSGEMTAREKLMVIINFYKKSYNNQFERGGCPLLNTSTEADDTMPFLKIEASRTFENWANRIRKILEKGKSDNEIVETANTSDYAFLFITLIEGGILLSKTTDNQHHLLNALARIEKIIDTELIK